ncbi:MAG TPA: hypothetical protein VF800_20980 [Telluria sp.]
MHDIYRAARDCHQLDRDRRVAGLILGSISDGFIAAAEGGVEGCRIGIAAGRCLRQVFIIPVLVR